jgi:hypothetical protein
MVNLLSTGEGSPMYHFCGKKAFYNIYKGLSLTVFGWIAAFT